MRKAYKIYFKRELGQDSRHIVFEFEHKYNPLEGKKFIPADTKCIPYSKEVLADFMIEVFHLCDGFTFPVLFITDEDDYIREVYETYIDESEEEGEVTGIQNWTNHTKYWDTDDEYRYFKGV